MAPTPIPSPGQAAGVTQPYNGFGGGQGFTASGPCSGTAWSHTQDLTIFYDIVRVPRPDGSWLPGSTDVSAMRLTVMGNAETSLSFFVTSGVSGTSGIGQCATAADARQAHVLAFSSSHSTNGMGHNGMIYTTSAGFERRWQVIGDVNEQDNRMYGNGLFRIDGLPAGWASNVTMSNQVMRAVVSRVMNGGVQYSNDGTSPPQTQTNWTLMRFNLTDL